MNRTIITVIGKDRVGIIARVCTYLAENDINVLISISRLFRAFSI